MNDEWQQKFRDLWGQSVAAWKAGRRSPATMFTPGDVAFLVTIGCSAQELFDFVDDGQEYGDVDCETTLAVTAIRRDYFLKVMNGRPTGRVVLTRDLPAKSAAVDGIAWLPRLIVKARLKLRGELNPDIMYGCGGDRLFLAGMNLTLPQFLQLVWDQGDNDRAIVQAVKKSGGLA